jgi:hypothetical protein
MTTTTDAPLADRVAALDWYHVLGADEVVAIAREAPQQWDWPAGGDSRAQELRREGLAAVKARNGIEASPCWLRPRTPVARLEGDGVPWWWQPNRAGRRRMVEAAGWEVVESTGVCSMPTGPAHPKPPVDGATLRAGLTPRGRERPLIRFLGVPHAALRVRPAT